MAQKTSVIPNRLATVSITLVLWHIYIAGGIYMKSNAGIGKCKVNRTARSIQYWASVSSFAHTCFVVKFNAVSFGSNSFVSNRSPV